jgi:hypothetical protein
MAQLVADAEPLKPWALNMRGVNDAEIVAVTEQHPGDALGILRLPFDNNVAARRDGEGIDGQAQKSFLLEKGFCRLPGKFQTEYLVQGS